METSFYSNALRENAQVSIFRTEDLMVYAQQPRQSALQILHLGLCLPFPAESSRASQMLKKESESILQDFLYCLLPRNTTVSLHWACRHVRPIKSIGVNKQKTCASNPINLVLPWKSGFSQRVEEPFLRGSSPGYICIQNQKRIPQVWLQKIDTRGRLSRPLSHLNDVDRYPLRSPSTPSLAAQERNVFVGSVFWNIFLETCLVCSILFH